ncbi:YgjV family protein [Candidatus Gracilibacteria bacterium]|nr:YgjV family protein [Candidatus Gracilibacteria bacterium]
MILLDYFQYFIEYILKDPFTQITGFMGMAVILLAYFQKDDNNVKKLMLLSSFFWGTHFYLLGVYAGLASVIIWVFRLFLSMKYQKSKNAFMSILCMVAIAAYFTYDGFFSLFPIITSVVGAYSYFFLEKIKLRLAMLLSSSIWLMYHVSIGSISGIINESFTQIILILTVYRMMHPEGGAIYYANKVRDILWKTRYPDYDRFIFIRDKVSSYRQSLGHSFQTLLHYDLRAFFGSQKGKFSNLHLLKKKDS